MRRLIISILISFLMCSVANAQFYTWRYRTHATDCTALTDGKATDQCKQLSDGSIYVCNPTSGDCDTPSEWKQTGKNYTASGTLLQLSGTAFSLKEGTLTTTKGCKYVSGTGIVCDQDYVTTTNNLWTQSGRVLYNTNGQSYSFSNPITDYQFIGAGISNVSHLSMFSAMTFQGQTSTSQTCSYTVSGNNVTGTGCDFATTLTFGSIFLSNASSVASIVYSITDQNHIAVFPPATASTGYVFIPPEFKGYTDGGGSAA